MSRNTFKVLEPDELDEEELIIRKVEVETDEPGKRKGNSGKKKGWLQLGVGDIIVDSAADESCWPLEEGGAFPTVAPRRRIILKAANGTEMRHYGEKQVTFSGSDGGEVVGLTFQVTDVRKPLLAVRRLVERGSVVKFGPKDEDNFIHNVGTGTRIPLQRKGGSFVIRAHFMKELAEQEQLFSGRVR